MKFPNKNTTYKTSRIASSSIVEYELHGKSILAVAVKEINGKWQLINDQNENISLPAHRLFLLPAKLPEYANNNLGRNKYFVSINNETKKIIDRINLEQLWHAYKNSRHEISIEELSQTLLKKTDILSILATRRALFNDRTYFQRTKSGFVSRSEESIKEQKFALERKQELEEENLKIVEFIITKLKDSKNDIEKPKAIKILENFSALGKNSPFSNRAKDILNQLKEVIKNHSDLDQEKVEKIIKSKEKYEDQFFDIFLLIDHFSIDENLELFKYNREYSFDDEVIKEAELISPLEIDNLNRKDLTNLKCITIDSISTEDIDDALSVEFLDNGHSKVGIHITDVSSFIKNGSLVDKEAIKRASSIYFLEGMLPMLPTSICNDKLSLIEGLERASLSFLVEFNSENEIINREVCKSKIKVSSRQNFESCNKDLLSDNPNPELLKLWEISKNLEIRREKNGANSFNQRELKAVLDTSGKLTLIPAQEDGPSQSLVAEFMILANETAALYAKENKIPLIFRSQDYPNKDDILKANKLEDGPAKEFQLKSALSKSEISYKAKQHASLGLDTYCQITSPLRRAFDLINHRQIVQFINSNLVQYCEDDLKEICLVLEPATSEATAIQRNRQRFWLLKYFEQEKISQFNGVIVKTTGTKPLAEIEELRVILPFNSKKDKTDSDLGKKVVLSIENINLRKAFIKLNEDLT